MRYCEACRAAFQERRTCPRDGLPTRSDLADPLVGAVLGERYRVLDHLASGGMGQVYRAAHTRIASLFAVKVLYGELAYEAPMRARFEREAEVASLLQSRHIVRVVDFSQSDSGLLYLAMEYLDGDTLAGLVRRAGRLEPRQALELAMQVARALAHAHERGVVHRDLKSENVMVIREDDADVAKVLDFGVARLRDSRVTARRAVLGTPAFMAPEQFAGDEVDGRADLYALGVTLHELLTGALPFDSDNPIDLMRRHLTEPPPPLAATLGNTRWVAALQPLVSRLLQKRKEDRFASARDFLDAARPLLEAPRDHAAAPPGARTAARGGVGLEVDRALLEAIRAAIELGAPTYNSGDHAGCAAVYRAVVEAALAPRRTPPLGLAERARLEVAQAQAAQAPGPTLAAWTLRHAFDDLATAAPVAPGPVRDPLDHAIDVFHAIAGRAYTLGHADAVAPFHLAFARLARAAAQQLPARAGDVAALEQAYERAQAASGDLGPALLSEAFDSLRQPRRPPDAQVLGTNPTSLGPPAAAISEVVRAAIHRAIRVGVPAYNSGDHAACAREYLRTTDAIVGECRRQAETARVAAWLAPIAERARVASPHDAAWTLRHAFDALLALP